MTEAQICEDVAKLAMCNLEPRNGLWLYNFENFVIFANVMILYSVG
jgi:hypothetical protein